MKLAKEWYKSQTIVAVIALLLLVIKNATGVELLPSEIDSILSNVTMGLLWLVAIYGRITATKKIN